MLGPLDVSLFRWINNAWATPVLDEVFRFLSIGTKLWSVRVALGVVLIAMVLRGPRSRSAALLAMAAWPVANALCDVVKHTFQALRPCVELEGVRLVQDYAGKPMFLDSFGTMSAHSANMAAVGMVMTLKLRWWGLPWIVIALMTGLSRIYTGVHYPSQVMLGWLGGCLCGWVAVKTWDAFIQKKSLGKTEALGQ